MKNFLKKISNKFKPSKSELILLLVVLILIILKFKSDNDQYIIQGKDYSKNRAGETDLYHPYGEGISKPDEIDK